MDNKVEIVDINNLDLCAELMSKGLWSEKELENNIKETLK